MQDVEGSLLFGRSSEIGACDQNYLILRLSKNPRCEIWVTRLSKSYPQSFPLLRVLKLLKCSAGWKEHIAPCVDHTLPQFCEANDTSNRKVPGWNYLVICSLPHFIVPTTACFLAAAAGNYAGPAQIKNPLCILLPSFSFHSCSLLTLFIRKNPIWGFDRLDVNDYILHGFYLILRNFTAVWKGIKCHVSKWHLWLIFTLVCRTFDVLWKCAFQLYSWVWIWHIWARIRRQSFRLSVTGHKLLHKFVKMIKSWVPLCSK